MPLFSIRSEAGWGIGEIPDLAQFATWAGRAGFSVLQLLPVNDASAAAQPSPYAATSAFALDPAYLSLDACEDFAAAGGREALPAEVQGRIPALQGSAHVEWSAVRAVKREGIRLAFARFLRDEWQRKSLRAEELAMFMRDSRAWLDDYALYTVLHETYGKSWLDWPAGARDRNPGTIAALRHERGDALLEVKWLQWQLERQWRRARLDASATGVELMGDLPFVVGVDSADVWANRTLFRLDQHVAAPPEEGSPEGQDWGLPAYDWSVGRRDDFAWIRARATRAGQLYGLYRIDHATGFYRTFVKSTDGKSSGFSPADEPSQIHLGESLMRLMSRFGEVVAEDLGAVPPYLRPSLERLTIPGYRVLRWEKDGDAFRDPATWPVASVATNGTHDTETTAEWYERLSPEEREHLRQLPGLSGLDPKEPFDDRVRDALLRVIYAAPSTLCLVPFPDLMGTKDRVNAPGTVGAANWTMRAERSIAELLADEAGTTRLARLADDSGRAPAGER
jgi:4-alpha-glucanotransferase